MMRSYYAKGRLKPGQMNDTEAAYSRLLEGKKLTGEVAWYKFEALKLRLADKTFYTPDFAVMLSSGELQCHEVKGARAVFMDDARVKIKVAASLYPLRFIAAYPTPKKRGGGWDFEEF